MLLILMYYHNTAVQSKLEDEEQCRPSKILLIIELCCSQVVKGYSMHVISEAAPQTQFNGTKNFVMILV